MDKPPRIYRIVYRMFSKSNVRLGQTSERQIFFGKGWNQSQAIKDLTTRVQEYRGEEVIIDKVRLLV